MKNGNLKFLKKQMENNKNKRDLLSYEQQKHDYEEL